MTQHPSLFQMLGGIGAAPFFGDQLQNSKQLGAAQQQAVPHRQELAQNVDWYSCANGYALANAMQFPKTQDEIDFEEAMAELDKEFPGKD